MIERALLDGTSPKTQSAEAIKSLLAWKRVSCDPLPEFVEMGKGDSRLVLVLNNKKDAYYTVTSRSCSCPASVYNPGKPCKHSMKYFPQQRREAPKEQGDLRVTLPGWPGGMNGPVEAI